MSTFGNSLLHDGFMIGAINTMALDGLKVGASLKKKMVSLVIQSRILLDSLDSINQQFEFEFEIFDLSKIEINIFTNYGNNE
jgi:hypothetical protein